MRKSSVIALIVGACLVLAGVIVAIVGVQMSKSQAIPLYEDNIDEEGNKIDLYDLGQYANKNTLNLKLKKAKVEVYYSKEESSIELRNFANYSYAFTSDGNSLTIDNTSSNPLISFKSITKGDLHFNGLRFFSRLGAFDGDEQRVIVKLNANKVKEISNIYIEVEEGAVFIKGFPEAAAKFDIKMGEGNVALNKTYASTLNVNIAKGDFSTFKSKADFANVIIGTGSVDAELAWGSKVTVEIDSGLLTIDGENQELPYTKVYGDSEGSRNEFVLKSKNGDVALRASEYTKPKSATPENTENTENTNS